MALLIGSKNLETEIFEWIISNRHQFSHSLGKSPEEQLKLLKPIGELVLCCDVMIRYKVLENEARSTLDWAWKELENGNFLLKALLSRPSLLMISSLYSTFHRNGYLNIPLRDLIAYHSTSSFTKSMQYPYWRRLDLELALFDMGLAESFKPKQDLTWSFHQPQPWMIDNDSAYALTHEIFYLTDFGRNKHLLLHETREYILSWLPAWLKLFLMDSNLDIYCELLMVSACIGKTEHFKEGSSILSREISVSGCIRGPKSGGKNLVSEETCKNRIFF